MYTKVHVYEYYTYNDDVKVGRSVVGRSSPVLSCGSSCSNEHADWNWLTAASVQHTFANYARLQGLYLCRVENQLQQKYRRPHPPTTREYTVDTEVSSVYGEGWSLIVISFPNNSLLFMLFHLISSVFIISVSIICLLSTIKLLKCLI